MATVCDCCGKRMERPSLSEPRTFAVEYYPVRASTDGAWWLEDVCLRCRKEIPNILKAAGFMVHCGEPLR